MPVCMRSGDSAYPRALDGYAPASAVSEFVCNNGLWQQTLSLCVEMLSNELESRIIIWKRNRWIATLSSVMELVLDSCKE